MQNQMNHVKLSNLGVNDVLNPNLSKTNGFKVPIVVPKANSRNTMQKKNTGGSIPQNGSALNPLMFEHQLINETENLNKNASNTHKLGPNAKLKSMNI
jgi:hypothetical protein